MAVITEFFLPMLPPTVTAQERAIRIEHGKPSVYEPQRLKDARAKLEAHLAGHQPVAPLVCGIRLIVRWYFPRGHHPNGAYRLTRPDTDNLNKMLKDCMTRLGFWRDDALVASELIEKFWADIPGIYIRLEALE